MLLNTLFSFGIFLLTSFSAIAQSAQVEEIAMADTFRAEGKIYVVVAVILLLFAGLVFYAVRIERKVNRLEKELEK
ncbi:CcmD family protein [Catalinimonas alkaloidigena]|uniref:CcmD family protein n=1 Tax=Catalinimonas alkaloidigena TaxID=1075417 RepID=UPI0024052D6B|nr:CcmD family protein [Catalinimonas alkaloidigena]